MTFIELGDARQAILETILMDVCDLTLPADGRDAIFNEDTGLYQDLPADAPIATDIPCMVREEGQGVDTDFNATRDTKRYTVNVPWDTPVPVKGTLVTVTASQDAGLVGAVLVVSEIVERTVLVMRTLRCWRRIDALDPR